MTHIHVRMDTCSFDIVERVSSYVEVELDLDQVIEVPSERDIYKYPGDLVLQPSMKVKFGDVKK